MNGEPLIVWHAPEHLHKEKNPDWYWAVGIITLAIAAVCFILGQIITGIFVLVAATALVIHTTHPPRLLRYEINDRGLVIDDTLFPFLHLDSFYIPHDEWPPRLLVKSRKMYMPLMVIFIDEVDPEDIRRIMLKYIAETEHRESVLKLILEKVGF